MSSAKSNSPKPINVIRSSSLPEGFQEDPDFPEMRLQARISRDQHKRKSTATSTGDSQPNIISSNTQSGGGSSSDINAQPQDFVVLDGKPVRVKRASSALGGQHIDGSVESLRSSRGDVEYADSGRKSFTHTRAQSSDVSTTSVYVNDENIQQSMENSNRYDKDLFWLRKALETSEATVAKQNKEIIRQRKLILEYEAQIALLLENKEDTKDSHMPDNNNDKNDNSTSSSKSRIRSLKVIASDTSGDFITTMNGGLESAMDVMPVPLSVSKGFTFITPTNAAATTALHGTVSEMTSTGTIGTFSNANSPDEVSLSTLPQQQRQQQQQ
eukprot:CAMPEP_0174961480 /NCGR_PEP_ID=MMETSP0004_2-20121128/4261_1 /TAXON_ID=420556 /ORGANISM="Ochromonas sp., Strain CCMP1393" /LENGTH=326 /DNA_ID=CAMNT_0016209925 /DNA_START=72 /DNA_END=1049 /DNA_ORIENTATION=+